MPVDFPSWLWWFFTTIVLAILINLISEYVKPKIDSVWGEYSEKQRIKNTEKEEQVNNAALEMIKDSDEASYISFLYNRTYSNFFAYAIIIFLFITILIQGLFFTVDISIDKTHQLVFAQSVAGIPLIIMAVVLLGALVVGILFVISFRRLRYLQQVVNRYRYFMRERRNSNSFKQIGKTKKPRTKNSKLSS